MPVITLLANSETHPDDPYTVSFHLMGNTLKIACTCPAGEKETLCKHRIALASNDPRMLFDSRQREILGQVHAIVLTSSLPSLFQEMQELQSTLEETKKKLQRVKAMAGKYMQLGLKLDQGD